MRFSFRRHPKETRGGTDKRKLLEDFAPLMLTESDVSSNSGENLGFDAQPLFSPKKKPQRRLDTQDSPPLLVEPKTPKKKTQPRQQKATRSPPTVETPKKHVDITKLVPIKPPVKDRKRRAPSKKGKDETTKDVPIRPVLITVEAKPPPVTPPREVSQADRKGSVLTEAGQSLVTEKSSPSTQIYSMKEDDLTDQGESTNGGSSSMWDGPSNSLQLDETASIVSETTDSVGTRTTTTGYTISTGSAFLSAGSYMSDDVSERFRFAKGVSPPSTTKRNRKGWASGVIKDVGHTLSDLFVDAKICVGCVVDTTRDTACARIESRK